MFARRLSFSRFASFLRPALAVVLAMVAASTAGAFAQDKPGLPGDVAEVGLDPKLDAQIPLDLTFTDSAGEEVVLGDLFDGERPVLLTLNYSNCPMLCTVQLNGLFEGLEGVDWDLGDKYRMVTVSIDPSEPPERAADTKEKYLKIYGRSGVEQGWDVLVGKEENIRRLADAIGFGYAYLPENDQYAHAAVTTVCTPDGRVSQYLTGVKYPAKTVRLALLEAADGKIGSALDYVTLLCYQYDPADGVYSLAAMRLVRIGGTATLVILAGVLVFFWRREARRAPRGAVAKPEPQA